MPLSNKRLNFQQSSIIRGLCKYALTWGLGLVSGGSLKNGYRLCLASPHSPVGVRVQASSKPRAVALGSLTECPQDIRPLRGT